MRKINFQAALWDNVELLEDLLRGDQIKLINSQDSWGRTPLHAAAITENSQCLKILLKSGGNPDIQCGPRGENKVFYYVSNEAIQITIIALFHCRLHCTAVQNTDTMIMSRHY